MIAIVPPVARHEDAGRREAAATLVPGARVAVAGAWIDNLSMTEAVHAVDRMLSERDHGYVVTPNVDHLVRLRRDPEFRQIYAQAALVLADGMPIVWASRFLGTPLKERVAGSDLFPRLCELAAQRGHRLFLLGGRPGAAARAAERLRAKHPTIQIVGAYAPPYGFEADPGENARIVAMIVDARADILFVGLGAPKQEKWIWRYQKACGVPVCIGIGVSFEFTAGMVRRAPMGLQRLGLEWLWRLAMEPRRLWRRYFWEDLPFLWYLVEQRLRQTFP